MHKAFPDLLSKQEQQASLSALREGVGFYCIIIPQVQTHQDYDIFVHFTYVRVFCIGIIPVNQAQMFTVSFLICDSAVPALLSLQAEESNTLRGQIDFSNQTNPDWVWVPGLAVAGTDTYGSPG